MTDEASTEAGEQPVVELDRRALAEAKLYGVEYRAYSAMPPRERAAIKMRWAKRIRIEAKRRGVDPDEFLAMTEEQRELVREEHPERPVVLPRKTRSIDDVAAAHVAPSRETADYVDEGLSRGDDPYSSASEVPATEGAPEHRDRPTLGDVRPSSNQDLIGWVQPKNLLDVYARYTIGDGQHFIRVERIEPKVFQQLACAGFLGEIRDPITEEDFARRFGGRSYTLQVYGPDPKGRRDPLSGNPIIKPKTEGFRYTVPVVAPNLLALPGLQPKRGTESMQPMHPMFGQSGIPTTPADAAMHKSTLDFVNTALQRAESNNQELRKELSGKSAASADVLSVVADTGKAAMQAAERASEAREARLDGIITSLREDNKALRDKLDRISEREPRESPMKDVAEVLRVTSPAQSLEQQVARQQSAHSEEIQRLKEAHRDQLESLRASNKEALESQKTRHEDELKRLRERADQDEKLARARVDDIEKRMRDRETELKDQMNDLRREEIARADQRVKDAEKTYEGRIADLKERHASELRMQTEQHQTRVDTSKSTFEMQLSNYKEREKRLQEELAEAKETAESAGDPVQILEKQKTISEALGYKKDDDSAPQTAGERFAATAGIGISKAFETIGDWGPKVAQAIGQRQGPAMGGPPVGALPPGARPRRPAPPPGRPQSRVVSWATQHSVPSDQQPTMPPEPVAQPPAPEPAPPMAAPPEAPPMEAPPAPPQPTNGQASSGNRFSAHFSDEVIAQFRTQVELFVNAGRPAAEFATRFLTLDTQAAMVMVTEHKSEEFIETVRAMPGGADSAILRPDGKRWVQALWKEVPAQYERAMQQAQAPQPSEEQATQAGE